MTEDPLTPVEAGAHIPGAELPLIPGMGHDFPAPLIDGVAAALADHCAPAAAS